MARLRLLARDYAVLIVGSLLLSIAYTLYPS